MRIVALLGAIAVVALPAMAQHHLASAEAKSHVGETATVCGEVVSTRYAASAKGHPTFLNLDKPYPNQEFTIVIWGEDRGKFASPEARYRGANICVTGHISMYRGSPEIIATEPSQLKIKGK